jgi:hypothetical protein
MPKGTKGREAPGRRDRQRRPCMRVATGEVEDQAQQPKPGKDAAAADLGKRGGAARARSLTPEQRSEIAKKGAASRWKKPA